MQIGNNERRYARFDLAQCLLRCIIGVHESTGNAGFAVGGWPEGETEPMTRLEALKGTFMEINGVIHG
jgi:hypothetical protein